MKHLWRYGMSFTICYFVGFASTLPNCPPPDVPTNGNYTSDGSKFLPGDKVTYTCNDGFLLVGKDSRICKSDGVWSDSTPFCDRSAKLKNPHVPNMTAPLLISSIIDDKNNTCFTWKKSIGRNLHLQLDEKVVVHSIRIFLKTDTTKIQVFTGLDNNMTKCGDYDEFIQKEQWILIKCERNRALADKIEIRKTEDTTTNISICEIQVYIKDENSCENPPDLSVPNGYFEIDRHKATLICEDGYKSKSGRLVCEEKSWKKPGSRCDEILCVPFSSIPSTIGDWKVLESVEKISAGTRMKLECNNGYRTTGDPDIVTCQKNGAWSKTNATCIEEKPGKPIPTIGIIEAVGAVVAVIILLLLGITVYLLSKQKRREFVVVYKSTGGSIAPGSESEYRNPYYETIGSSVSSTSRPPALPPILSDVYVLPADSRGATRRKSSPVDIAIGTLKDSPLYGN